jgi:Protein of unknown function (DUF1761)
MDVAINYWAVLLAAASSMVVGAIWYAGPVFGNTWAKLAKIDAKKAQSGAGMAMVGAFLLSLLTAYVLAHVSYLSNHFFGHSFFQDAVSTAFWVWLGFVATRIVTHNIFEQKPGKLNLLAIGNEFVTIMLMGVIIGWLAP